MRRDTGIVICSMIILIGILAILKAAEAITASWIWIFSPAWEILALVVISAILDKIDNG